MVRLASVLQQKAEKPTTTKPLSWLPFGFIRTFGDQISILNQLQPMSGKLKIAPKRLM